MYESFKDIAERHNFPPDFPNAEVAGGLLGMMLETPGFEAAVAEEDGSAVGSIFVSRRSPVGIGSSKSHRTHLSERPPENSRKSPLPWRQV